MIGWYAHHQGAGHVTRACLVGGLLDSEVTVLSSAPRPAGWPAERWVSLPRDDDPDDTGVDPSAGGALHWAPRGSHGYDARMAAVASWLLAAEPDLLVCDVSVEVTLLARLLGVPVVVAVMAGDRSDRAHRAAYDAATALVAAWPADPGPSLVTGWDPAWTGKTKFVGGLSRFDRPVEHQAPREVDPTRVTLLWGAGGDGVDEATLDATRAATPTWDWTVCAGLPPERVRGLLDSAAVVVSHAGQNAVAEVAAAGRPAVVLAQPRPHDEQGHLARGLAQLGLTGEDHGWPAADRWPGLLEDAVRRGPPDWSRWSDGRGAARYAAHLDALAAQLARPRS